MISKKTQIILGCVSIVFIVFLTLPIPALGYITVTQENHRQGRQNNYTLALECELSISMEVHLQPATGGGYQMTGVITDWDFWGDLDWIWWPFWWWKWRFGSATELTILWLNQYDEITYAYYRLKGKIYRSDNVNIKAWISIWVAIYSTGEKDYGSSIWDDNTGLVWINL